jgi:hypothetical protein
MPEELLHWASTLLHEIYDDDYYYHCKYFYYLLTSAYTAREDQGMLGNCAKKT